jgi:membrane carboxypeptidase/penicillin-binding protein
LGGERSRVSSTRMHTLRRLLVVTVVGGLGLAIATVLLGTQVRTFFVDGIGGGDVDVNLQPLATRSVVYSRDGTELFQLHAEENRVPVSIDRVPPHLIQAVLDAEDERYWDHGALDVRGIGRPRYTPV